MNFNFAFFSYDFTISLSYWFFPRLKHSSGLLLPISLNHRLTHEMPPFSSGHYESWQYDRISSVHGTNSFHKIFFQFWESILSYIAKVELHQWVSASLSYRQANLFLYSSKCLFSRWELTPQYNNFCSVSSAQEPVLLGCGSTVQWWC